MIDVDGIERPTQVAPSDPTLDVMGLSAQTQELSAADDSVLVAEELPNRRREIAWHPHTVAVAATCRSR